MPGMDRTAANEVTSWPHCAMEPYLKVLYMCIREPFFLRALTEGNRLSSNRSNRHSYEWVVLE